MGLCVRKLYCRDLEYSLLEYSLLEYSLLEYSLLEYSLLEYSLLEYSLLRQIYYLPTECLHCLYLLLHIVVFFLFVYFYGESISVFLGPSLPRC